MKNKIFVKKNIPNILLVVRMLLVPAIVGLLIADYFCESGNPLIYSLFSPFNRESTYTHIHLFFLIAGILFVIAAITDWLDGRIARKYNWVSNFGKFWDPVADKVLINSVLICFAAATIVPIYIPIITIIRDVIVDAQRMTASKKDIVVAANYWGKLKTILQMVGIIFIMFFFNAPYFNDVVNEPAYQGIYWGVQNLFLHLATIMSVVSGIVYFTGINRKMRNQHGKQN